METSGDNSSESENVKISYELPINSLICINSCGVLPDTQVGAR
jgi:hypothetical protein